METNFQELTLNVYIISRLTHKFYARELRKLHLTLGQFPFIMGIVNNDGISQENLSALLRIGKSTTATIIRQLLNAEFITREVDDTDRRNFKLHATGKAHMLMPKILDMIDRCHTEITATLSEIERDTFSALTDKVRLHTEDALGGKQK